MYRVFQIEEERGPNGSWPSLHQSSPKEEQTQLLLELDLDESFFISRDQRTRGPTDLSTQSYPLQRIRPWSARSASTSTSNHQNIHTSRPTSAHRARRQQPDHVESNLRMTSIEQRGNVVRLNQTRRRPHSATLSQRQDSHLSYGLTNQIKAQQVWVEQRDVQQSNVKFLSPQKLKQKILHCREASAIAARAALSSSASGATSSALTAIIEAIRQNILLREQLRHQIQFDLTMANPQTCHLMEKLSPSVQSIKLLNKLRSLTLLVIEMIFYFQKNATPQQRLDPHNPMKEFQAYLLKIISSDMDFLAYYSPFVSVFQSNGASLLRNPLVEAISLHSSELLLSCCNNGGTSTSFDECLVSKIETFGVCLKRKWKIWQLLPSERVAAALQGLLLLEMDLSSKKLLPKYSQSHEHNTKSQEVAYSLEMEKKLPEIIESAAPVVVQSNSLTAIAIKSMDGVAGVKEDSKKSKKSKKQASKKASIPQQTEPDPVKKEESQDQKEPPSRRWYIVVDPPPLPPPSPSPFTAAATHVELTEPQLKSTGIQEPSKKSQVPPPTVSLVAEKESEKDKMGLRRIFLLCADVNSVATGILSDQMMRLHHVQLDTSVSEPFSKESNVNKISSSIIGSTTPDTLKTTHQMEDSMERPPLLLLEKEKKLLRRILHHFASNVAWIRAQRRAANTIRFALQKHVVYKKQVQQQKQQQEQKEWKAQHILQTNFKKWQIKKTQQQRQMLFYQLYTWFQRLRFGVRIYLKQQQKEKYQKIQQQKIASIKIQHGWRRHHQQIKHQQKMEFLKKQEEQEQRRQRLIQIQQQKQRKKKLKEQKIILKNRRHLAKWKIGFFMYQKKESFLFQKRHRQQQEKAANQIQQFLIHHLLRQKVQQHKHQKVQQQKIASIKIQREWRRHHHQQQQQQTNVQRRLEKEILLLQQFEHFVQRTSKQFIERSLLAFFSSLNVMMVMTLQATNQKRLLQSKASIQIQQKWRQYKAQKAVAIHQVGIQVRGQKNQFIHEFTLNFWSQNILQIAIQRIQAAKCIYKNVIKRRTTTTKHHAFFLVQRSFGTFSHLHNNNNNSSSSSSCCSRSSSRQQEEKEINNEKEEALVTIFNVVDNANVEKALILKKQGANFHLMDTKTHQNVLHRLAETEEKNLRFRLEMLFFLLKEKIDVNARDFPQGNTPLMLYVSSGQLEMVQCLLEHPFSSPESHTQEVDLTCVNANGQNVLHVACIHDQVEICGFLHQYLLMLSNAKEKEKENDLVLLLHQQKDAFGLTPLHIVAQNGYLECAKQFLEQNSSDNMIVRLLTQCDNEGRLPFHLALMQGHVDMVQLFLQVSSSSSSILVNACDPLRRFPLHFAMETPKASLALINLLVQYGAQINVVDERGDTPLHWAAFNGRKDIIKLLLTLQADPMILNSDWETPSQIAATYGHQECMCLLLHAQKQQAQRVQINAGIGGEVQEQSSYSSSMYSSFHFATHHQGYHHFPSKKERHTRGFSWEEELHQVEDVQLVEESDDLNSEEEQELII